MKYIFYLVLFSTLSITGYCQCNEENYSNEDTCLTHTFPTSRVLFFGEIHDDTYDNDIKYDIISNIIKDEDTIKVLFEAGHATAYLMNKYIHTGNKEYIDNYCWTDWVYYCLNEQVYNLLKTNKNVSIKYYGIDYERNSTYTLNALHYLLEPLPDSIFIQFSKDDLYDLCESSFETKSRLVYEAYQLYKNNISLFEETLKDEIIDLKLIFRSYNEMLVDSLKNKQYNIKREEWLYKNILQQINIDSTRIILFLGVEHCSYNNVLYDNDPVAKMLKEKGINVCAIHIFYDKQNIMNQRLGLKRRKYNEFFSKYQSSQVTLVSTKCNPQLRDLNLYDYFDYALIQRKGYKFKKEHGFMEVLTIENICD